MDGKSAEGTIVVPYSTYLGMPIKNLKIIYKGGKMTGMSADSSSEMLKKFFDSSSPDTKDLSIVDFGLNPNSKPISNSTYLSWEMAGVVSLNMGNNSWAGGDNMADGGFSFQLTDTTVSVGDQTLVRDGSLANAAQ